MLSLLQKAKTLKELMSLTESLKNGQLKLLEKAKTLKRVMELVELLGGEGITPIVKDYTLILKQIVNDEINIFEAKEKMQELELAVNTLNTESIDEDTKSLIIEALRNATRQIAVANKYVVLD